MYNHDDSPINFAMCPTLDFEYLSDVISDVRFHIETACKTNGMFDKPRWGASAITYSKYYRANGIPSTKGLINCDKADLCFFDPLKNLSSNLDDYLKKVDNWGMRVRHMKEVTIPVLNRHLDSVQHQKTRRKLIETIRTLLRDNNDISDRYINTFSIITDGFETPIEDLRNLVDFISLIINEGSGLKAEASGFLPDPYQRRRKISDPRHHGHGHPSRMEDDGSSSRGADKANITPFETEDSSRGATRNKNSTTVPYSFQDMFSSIHNDPIEEPQLLRATNTNLISIDLYPETSSQTQSVPYNPHDPTEANLKSMSKATYNATRFTQDYYARSPTYLHNLSSCIIPPKPTRNEGLAALDSTPKWKVLFMDRHDIDRLHASERELEIFKICLLLARKALGKAVEAAAISDAHRKLALEMRRAYDLYWDLAKEMEDKIVSLRFVDIEDRMEMEGVEEWVDDGDEEEGPQRKGNKENVDGACVGKIDEDDMDVVDEIALVLDEKGVEGKGKARA